MQSVWITRTRGGVEVRVWPPAEDPGIAATAFRSKRGSWVAKGISCAPGDVLTMYVDHGESTPQTLTKATATIELVQGSGATGANYTFNDGEGSVTGEIPSNTRVGDLLLAFVASAEPTVSTPSGWTRKTSAGPNTGADDQKYVLDWKVAVIGEPDITYNVSGGSGATDVGVLVARFPASQVDTALPFDSTVDTETPATGTSSIGLSTTSTTDNAILVFFGTHGDDDTTTAHTYDGGLTKRVQATGSQIGISLAQLQLGTAGATGTKTMTATPTPSWIAGFLFALKPA